MADKWKSGVSGVPANGSHSCDPGQAAAGETAPSAGEQRIQHASHAQERAESDGLDTTLNVPVAHEHQPVRMTRLLWAAALLGGVFFLVHPANVEAVAWVSQLKTVAALTFSLAALLASRSAAYAEAECEVDTEGRSPDEVVDEALKQLRGIRLTGNAV